MKQILVLLIFTLLLSACTATTYEGSYDSIIQSYTKDGLLYVNHFDSSGTLSRSIYKGESKDLSTEGLELLDKSQIHMGIAEYGKLDKLFTKLFSAIPSELTPGDTQGERQALVVKKDNKEEKREGINASLEGPKEFIELFKAFDLVLTEANKPRG